MLAQPEAPAPSSQVSGFFDIEEETHALYAQANFEMGIVRGNFGVRYLETDRVVERRDLLLHGLDDFRVAMPEARRPETGKQVVDPTAVAGRVVMSTGARDDARLGLEVAIRGERHPVGV